MQIPPLLATFGAVTATHTTLTLCNNELFVRTTGARPNRFAVAVYSASSMATTLLAAAVLYKLNFISLSPKSLGHRLLVGLSMGAAIHVGYVAGRYASNLVTRHRLTPNQISTLFRSTIYDATKVTFGVLLGMLLATHKNELHNYLSV